MHVKILLVDDHIPITDYLGQMIQKINKPVHIDIANTLQVAYQKLFYNTKASPFDLVFLDISMPQYSEKNINNGEDLAKLIKIQYPTIKIVFITGFYSNNQLDRIIRNIDPEGIIDKIDIRNEEFLKSVNVIISGERYKSKSIVAAINQYYESTNVFDSIDLQIVNLIKEGIKTKNMPHYLPMTLSGVHKRKQKIKEILGIDIGNDEDIIKECKIRGIFS